MRRRRRQPQFSEKELYSGMEPVLVVAAPAFSLRMDRLWRIGAKTHAADVTWLREPRKMRPAKRTAVAALSSGVRKLAHEKPAQLRQPANGRPGSGISKFAHQKEPQLRLSAEGSHAKRNAVAALSSGVRKFAHEKPPQLR